MVEPQTNFPLLAGLPDTILGSAALGNWKAKSEFQKPTLVSGDPCSLSGKKGKLVYGPAILAKT